MGTKTCPAEIRPLSKDEIDRRINSLIPEVTASARDVASEELGGCAPRWVSTSELVRCMRPFLVLN